MKIPTVLPMAVLYGITQIFFGQLAGAEETSVIKVSTKGGLVEGAGGVLLFKNGESCTDSVYIPLQRLKSGKLTPKLGEQITFGVDTPWEATERISESEQKLSICREIITITANADRYRVELLARSDRCEIRVNGLKIEDLPQELAADVKARKQISAQKNEPNCEKLTPSAAASETTTPP